MDNQPGNKRLRSIQRQADGGKEKLLQRSRHSGPPRKRGRVFRGAEIRHESRCGGNLDTGRIQVQHNVRGRQAHELQPFRQGRMEQDIRECQQQAKARGRMDRGQKFRERPVFRRHVHGPGFQGMGLQPNPVHEQPCRIP